jgi:menaquinone-dependent protoporphyrinogen oxidase
MATLIVYMTTHGCTEKATRMLMECLKDNLHIVNLEGVVDPDLSPYDKVVIGGSIHMGEIQKDLKRYCERNTETLLRKKLGLFLCCMFDGDVAKRQFMEAYPEALRNHASAIGMFGGEISLDRMNDLEKMIVKKVAKIDRDISKLNHFAIKQFAEAMTG